MPSRLFFSSGLSILDNVGLLNGDRHRLCFSSRETAQDTFYQTIWQGQVLYQALDTEGTTPYIFNWSCKHDYMQGLRRSLVYRPLLAFFLAILNILIMVSPIQLTPL